MPLTFAAARAYPCRAAAPTAAGGESPNRSGRKPHCVCHAAFLRLGVSAYGGAGRGSRKARRCSAGLSTPLGRRHPGVRARAAVAQCNRTEHIIMAANALSAPALAHPSAFTARESKAISYALHILESRCLKTGPVLTDAWETGRYLNLRLGGLTAEEYHVLYLDNCMRLIEAVCVGVGTINQVIAYPREIARGALERHAASVILAHNHPSGNAQPSDADLDNFAFMERALGAIDIRVVDSLVVTASTVTSMAMYRAEQLAREQREREARWGRERAERAAARAAKKAARVHGGCHASA